MFAGIDSDTIWRCRRLPGNSFCVDCGKKQPEWASISLGVFLCINCAGEHRGLGVFKSKVRSITMDSWSHVQLRHLLLGGNRKFKQYFRKCRVPWNFLSIKERYSCRQADVYRKWLSATAVDDNIVDTQHRLNVVTWKSVKVLDRNETVKLYNSKHRQSKIKKNLSIKTSNIQDATRQHSPRGSRRGYSTTSIFTSEENQKVIQCSRSRTCCCLDVRTLKLCTLTGVSISVYTLITSIIFPFVPYVSIITGVIDFEDRSRILLGAIVSTFLLGLELGGCVWNTISRMWGLKSALITSYIWIVCACVALGFSRTIITLTTTCLALGVGVAIYEILLQIVTAYFLNTAIPSKMFHCMRLVSVASFSLGPMLLYTMLAQNGMESIPFDLATTSTVDAFSSTSIFPLIKFGQILAFLTFTCLVIAYFWAPDNDDRYGGNHSKCKNRVSNRTRRNMSHRSYRMIAVDSFDHIPLSFNRANDLANSKVPDSIPYISPSASPLPSPILSYGNNSRFGTNEDDPFHQITIENYSQSNSDCGEEMESVENIDIVNDITKLDINSTEQKSNNINVGSTLSKNAKMLSTANFSILNRSPKQLASSSMVSSNAVTKSFSDSSSSSIKQNSWNGRKNASRVPQLLNSADDSKFTIRTYLLLFLAPFLERFTELSLILWFITPVQFGGFGWTAFELSIFFCITRFVAYFLLRILQKMYIVSSKSAEVLKRQHLLSQSKDNRCRCRVFGPKRIRLMWAICCTVCCILMPTIDLAVSADINNSATYYEHRIPSPSPTTDSSSAPMISSAVKYWSSDNLINNVVLWICLISLASGLLACMSLLTNWVVLMFEDHLQSMLTKRNGISTGKEREISRGINQNDVSEKCRLSNSNFSAVAIVGRVIAPFVASLCFFQSTPLYPYEGETLYENSNNISKSDSDYHYTTFWLISILCLSMAFIVVLDKHD